MKYRSLILIVVIAIGVVLIVMTQKNKTPYTRKAIVGLEIPEFSLIDERGRKISSSETKGKTVFVHFWASWCKECREEMPGIQLLYNRKKVEPTFVFLSVIYREDPRISRQWLIENNYDFPIFIDLDEKTARVFGVTGVPETYIIDPDGILRKKIIGPGYWGEI